MHPITLDTAPDERFALSRRLWQGCPTILRTPKGRLYAGWYSGGSCEPDPENYNLLIRSDDDGWTWSEPLLVVASETDNGFVAIDIQLWLDPENRMWMFITQRYVDGDRRLSDPDHLALWAAVCDDPDAETLTWSEPRFIANGFLRTQPTVLSNGDWVLCAYDWSSPNYRYSRSSDGGKTWVRCEAGRKLLPDFDETMILERRDGTLLMFARDFRPLLVRSESSDLAGTSWTPGVYTRILNAQSRFFLRRLRSGRVLLIHNDAATHRTNLCAKLSEDDGETWPYALTLDTAPNRSRNVSYPDAAEDENGRIFIVYDRGRFTAREILMAQITEEDIMAGTIVSEASYLSRIISKAPVPPDPEAYQKRREFRAAWAQEKIRPLYRGNDLFSKKIK